MKSRRTGKRGRSGLKNFRHTGHGPEGLTAYSVKNQERILVQCPHAPDVRGFPAWLKAGCVVRKGWKGIKVVAPLMGRSDGTPKVVNIKPAYVFDVTQSACRYARPLAANSITPERTTPGPFCG